MNRMMSPPPTLNSMEEANAYRREISSALCQAAQMGDGATVEALQARYAAIPLLIVGLVVRQVQERVEALETLNRNVQGFLAPLSAAEIATRTEHNRVLRADPPESPYPSLRAMEAAGAACAPVSKIGIEVFDALNEARKLIPQIQAALTRCVYDPNGGLVATDDVLSALSDQGLTYQKLRGEAQKAGVTETTVLQTAA